jgi:hypothetical protein
MANGNKNTPKDKIYQFYAEKKNKLIMALNLLGYH